MRLKSGDRIARPVTRSVRGEPGGRSPNLSKQVTVVKPTLERASASRETSWHSTPPRLWTEHTLRGGGRDKQARVDARREGGAGDGEQDVAGSEILVPMTEWLLVLVSW